jgi:uncharacterized protein
MAVEENSARQRLDWLLANFARDTHGVRDAAAVSSDGLLVSASDGLDRASADHLAALVSGLASLGRSASRRYDFNGLKLILLEMRSGFLLVSMIAEGGCLGVLADSTCDIGLVGYEISVLVDRVGGLLTPALISESRRQVPR